MAGVNPAHISRQLGHKTPELFFNVYAKWLGGGDRFREQTRLQTPVGTAAPALERNECFPGISPEGARGQRKSPKTCCGFLGFW